jgi:hypothetical protein
MRCAFEIASAARIGVYDCLHVTLAGVWMIPLVSAIIALELESDPARNPG